MRRAVPVRRKRRRGGVVNDANCKHCQSVDSVDLGRCSDCGFVRTDLFYRSCNSVEDPAGVDSGCLQNMQQEKAEAQKGEKVMWDAEEITKAKTNERFRQWYAQNKEKHKEYKKTWWDNLPEEKKEEFRQKKRKRDRERYAAKKKKGGESK